MHSILDSFRFPLSDEILDKWYESVYNEVKDCIPSNGSIDVPPRLTRDESLLASDLGEQGQLFLGQECGYPLLLSPNSFQIVGIPRFSSISCCSGHHYRSCVIVKDDSAYQSLHDFTGKDFSIAMNSRCSLSGNLLLAASLGRDLLQQCNGKVTYTGSHEASIAAVREGRADIAAVDCTSLSLMRMHGADLSGVRVIGFTVAAPNSPFVTSKSLPVDLLCILQQSVIAAIEKNAGNASGDLLLAGLSTSLSSAGGCASTSSDSSGGDFSADCQAYYTAYVKALQIRACSPSQYLLYEADSPIEEAKDAASDYELPETVDSPPMVTAAPDRDELQSLQPSDAEFILCLLKRLQEVSAEPEPVNTQRGAQYSVWSSYKRNGRTHSLRLLFPGGKAAAQSFFALKLQQQQQQQQQGGSAIASTPINLVCFMGRRQLVQLCSPHDLDVVRDCWATDAQIVNNLNSSVVAAYATGEVEPGGEWGNIVVFHEGHSAESNLMVSRSVDIAPAAATAAVPVATATPSEQTARDNTVGGSDSPSAAKSYSAQNHNAHRVAIQDVSPWYYGTVRIHRAALQPIINNSVDFDVNAGAGYNVNYLRTLSVRYSNSSVDTNNSNTVDSLSQSQYSYPVGEGKRATVITSRSVVQW